MKLSLRQKEYACTAVLTAGLLIMLIGSGGTIIPLLAGALISFGALALFIYWWRCPHCGQSLGRSKGEYCLHCGKKIDYDAK